MIHVWLEEVVVWDKEAMVSHFCHSVAQTFIKSVNNSLGILIWGGYRE